MPFVFTTRFYFLWAADVQNKEEEYGDLGYFEKIKTYSLVYNTSLSTITLLEEG